MEKENRLLTRDWDKYDTRQVVFKPKGMSAEVLKAGYGQAYKDFYSWSNIYRASQQHSTMNQRLRHFAYSTGWKKGEPLWNWMIQTGMLGHMRKVLEFVLDGSGEKKPVSINNILRAE